MNKEKDFVLYIIRSIVQYPEEVKVESSADDMGIFLQLWVSPKDMGIIIGRSGEHANAIKLLTKLCGFNNDKKVFLKIEEPTNE